MATIYDVARRAAVTAATVSNVMTGKGSVGEETRARVYAAIDELGYEPNLTARGLARRRSSILALLLPDIANPFYPEIALEVERLATAQGYHLLLCNTCYNPANGRAHLKGLIARRVDGLLAMEGGLDLCDVQEAGARGLPVVLCNWERGATPQELSAVAIDFCRGGELAARYLLDLGHRKLAVIVHGHDGIAAHPDRLAGFQAALAAAGCPLGPDALYYGDSTMESGYHAATALLRATPRPSALFATNDLMALGALEAASDLHIAVPERLSIVGFDDIMLGAHLRPTLTTIAIPKRALAAEATALLLRQVTAPRDQPLDPVYLAVSPALVIRGSTTGPPCERRL